jgi:hypothetical protein
MKELFPHQKLALSKMSNGKVLWGGVGSGKSFAAATYYLQREAPKDVYVITTARKRDDFDWQEQFYELGIGPKSGPLVQPAPVSVRVPESDNGKVAGRNSRSGSKSGPSTPDHRMHSSSKNGSREADQQQRSSVDCPEDLATTLGDSDLGPTPSRQRSLSDRRSDSGDMAGGVHRDVSTKETGSVRDSGPYPWVLTVDSWNNLHKYADVAGAFFIFDEQRIVGSGDWSRKFLRIAKRNAWILLSATPGDTWMDYVPLFIAHGFYKNRTAFKREHVVYNTFTKFPKVDRYINQGKLARLRAQILVEMPVERHTKRRHIPVMLPYDEALLDRVLKDRWHVYEDRPLNDVAEMFNVGRKVVNSDPSRLERVRELWQIHPRLIVFYNFNYELESLRNLTALSSSLENLPQKGWSSSETIRPGMGSDSWRNRNQVLAASSLTNSFENKRSLSNSSLAKSSSEHTTDGLMDISRKLSSVTAPVGLPESSTITERLHGITPRIGDSSLTGTFRVLPGNRSDIVMPASTSTTMENHRGTELSTTSTDGSILAEWNGHKHQPVPESSRWIYLVQYTAGAEAWECVTTDAMILHSQNYSWRTTQQAYGRTDRLNTPYRDLYYYGFTSTSFVDKAIERALKGKESFNVNKYKKMFEG